MNQTQLVKSAINIFIVVAVSISLFQELTKPASNSDPNVESTYQEHTNNVQSLPKVQGVRFYVTQKYQAQLQQILNKNNYPIQVSSYTFEGSQYWINMVLNWGHMVLIFVLVEKYKGQANADTKKKLMIGGALGVMAWFYLSSQFKPQRINLQLDGRIVYDKNYINEHQIIEELSSVEFQLDDIRDNKVPLINTNTGKVQTPKVSQHQDQIYDEIQF